MKSFGRELRVADDLRERLADIIRSRMRDPRVGMVSISEVKVAKDLSVADVYVSSIAADTPDKRQALERVLNNAAGFLRSEIAQQSTMRVTPKLRFHFDEIWQRAGELDELIDDAIAADRAAHDGKVK